MLLKGKRLLITGVLTDASIAFSVARAAQEQGAQVALTSFGRARRLTERATRRLPNEAPVYELDVTSDSDFAALAESLAADWGAVDGVLHAVAFAPAGCFGDFLGADWSDVSKAMEVSAY